MRSRILAIVGLTAGIFHQSSAQFVAENSATGPFSSDGSECHEICGRPHIAVVGYTIQDCRCDEIQSDTEVKFDLVKRQLTNTGPPGALLTSLFGGGKPSTESTETTATSTKDSLTTTQTSDAAQTSDANGDGTSSLSAGVAVTSTGTHSTAVTPHSTSASSSSDQSGNGAPLSDTSANAALSQSATIGIGVGVGVGVAILIGAIAAICIARRRRARARHEDIFNGKYEGHAPSESSMVEARDIPTSGLLPGAYMKQPLSQTTGYYESAGPYDAHQQPEPMMDRYMDHVDGYGSPPGGIVAPAAMPAAATITPTPSSPVSAIAAPVTSSTAPNSDRRPPSMAAICEDNPQTYQPTLPQPPQPPPTRQPTGVPLPVLQIPSPRDDERTPLASRQGTPMRSRSGSVSPVSPVSPMTPEDERPASLRGHS